MLVSIFLLLLIVSSATIIDGRSLNNPNQLVPTFLSSVITDNKDFTTSPSDGQNRLLHIIEQIIKYVSKIKSNENFINDIVNHQEPVLDKLKILKFLNNCFQITNTLIEREIHRLSHPNEKTFFTFSFTFEELQEAQKKIHHLLQVIEERMQTLKTWVPPTMPFLNF